MFFREKRVKKKILLLGVNATWSQSNPALYYLREMIADLPHEVMIKEITVNDPPERAFELIGDDVPDILGLSVYLWNRLLLREFIPRLRAELPGMQLVIGGAEAEILAAEIGLGEQDQVITGAGEAAFKSLALNDFNYLGNKSSPAHLPLREIPFPYRKEDLASLAGHLVYYECSRGCPFACAYCLSANDQRMEYRFDPGDAIERDKLHRELDYLVALKPRTVKFVDRSFNLNRALAHAVWEYVAQIDCACDFHFEFYPQALADSDLAVLSRMPEGRIRLEAGIQSVHDRHLARIGRSSDWSVIKPILIHLRADTRTHIHSDLLIGLPGESIADIAHSVNETMQTMPHELQLGVLKILPDTPMLRIAVDCGYEWDALPPYPVRKTDALSNGDIRYLEEIARLINLYWNRKNHTGQIQELMMKRDAFEIMAEIHRIHVRKNLQYWGISARIREEILIEVKTLHTFS